MSGLTSALAGANLIYGSGMLDLGMTFSFAQLVMDNEFVKMIKHVVGGIPVNDKTLCVDLIKQVGSQKDFFTDPDACMDTHGKFKQIQSLPNPELIDRRMRQDWEKSGKTTMTQRAEELARNILETHKPVPLPENVQTTIRDIVKETEMELGILDTEESKSINKG